MVFELVNVMRPLMVVLLNANGLPAVTVCPEPDAT